MCFRWYRNLSSIIPVSLFILSLLIFVGVVHGYYSCDGAGAQCSGNGAYCVDTGSACGGNNCCSEGCAGSTASCYSQSTYAYSQLSYGGSVSCNSVSASMNPSNGTSPYSATFSWSGDASTFYSDTWTAGSTSGCSATGGSSSGGSITCTVVGNGTWTQQWKHCSGSFSNCSGTCENDISYTAYSQGSYYAQSTYYGQSTYYAQNTYYSQGAYAPSNFTVNTPTQSCNGSSNPVTITWGQPSPATSYSVFRSANGSSYSVLTSGQAPTLTSYTDTGVSDGVSYTYLVRAFNSGSYTDSYSSAFITDCSGPSVSIYNFPPGGVACLTPGNWPTLQMNASDSITSINNTTVGFKIVNASTTVQDFGAGAPTPVSGNSNYNYQQTTSAPTITKNDGTKYYLVGYAKDIRGNSGQSSNAPLLGFTYNDSCAAPFIQTQNGDVHSNQNVK